MKTTIYYFSGTGNSLKIAKDLHEKLEECEIIPIPKVWQQKPIFSRTEKVGFICPLYFWGLPDIVLDFVKKIELHKGNYFFAVVTRGGTRGGGALHQLKKQLKKKSKKLNAGFYITMPDNYLPYFEMISEEKQKTLFEKAREKVDKISEIVKDNKKMMEKEILYFVGTFVNKRFRKKVNDGDRKFNIDDNCDSCEICERVCPVNNIILIGGKPQWQHKCQRCLACIHFCPQEAIQYSRKTINKKRYHHPEITIEDIINQK